MDFVRLFVLCRRDSGSGWDTRDKEETVVKKAKRKNKECMEGSRDYNSKIARTLNNSIIWQRYI